MIALRDYQIDAVEKTFAASRQYKNILIVAPTASGKSLIIAGLIDKFIKEDNSKKILVLCHQREILLQNQSKILNYTTSIYCAALAQKDLSGQIVLASRDSLGKKNLNLPHFDVVIIDEAHLINTKEESRYMRILNSIQYKSCIGLTGSPWRLDNGLIFGDGKFFEHCSYAIPMSMLIQRGYLSKFFFPNKEDVSIFIETKGIKKQNGDFAIKELASRSIAAVQQCIDRWEILASKYNRRCSIMFCTSIAHAELVESELIKRNYKTSFIIGSTDKDEREDIIIKARNGDYQCIITVGCLTTGVDIPIIDCAVIMRATMSASLFVQMIGRALRVHEGKKDALILDFTDNFDRFNSIEAPLVNNKKRLKNKKENEDVFNLLQDFDVDFELNKQITKTCSNCKTEVHIATRVCYICGELFLNQNNTPHHVDDDERLEDWMELISIEGPFFQHFSSGNSGYTVKYKAKKNGQMITLTEYIVTVFKDSNKKYLEYKNLNRKDYINKIIKTKPTKIKEETSKNGFKSYLFK